MLSLKLSPDEAVDLLVLLTRNGKNRLSRRLKNIITDGLESEKETYDFGAAAAWFDRQRKLIDQLERNEDEDVSKN